MRFWIWGLLAIATSLAAITRQSLWIDEALTATKASQSNLSGWWHAMLADKASDLQMPLYMIYMWGFAKIFGAGEFALRAANIPWFAAGIAAFVSSLRVAPAGKDFKDRPLLPILCAALICPFAWYYLDEARPYAMQLGAGLMIFGAIARVGETSNPELGPSGQATEHRTSNIEEKVPPLPGPVASQARHESVSRKGMCASRIVVLLRSSGGEGVSAAGVSERFWLAAFFFGVIALSGSSLLGMIWAGAACLALFVFLPLKRIIELARAHFVIVCCSFACLLALAIYYLWTLKVGARASDVGATDARNVFFIVYELLGFSGLGPGRLEIRNDGLRAFSPFAIPLALYGVFLCDIAIQGFRKIFLQPLKSVAALAVAIAAPGVLILIAGWTQHFRVLGRHFMPLLPVVIYILWLGMEARCAGRNRFSKAVAWAFAIMALASCLSFRFAARHAKDDYRDAAAFAKAELNRGKTVWWSAGREGALYYGVPLEESPTNRGAIWLMNPAPQTLEELPAPGTIIISKPDIYDGQGVVSQYVRKGGYLERSVLPAFTIWQQQPGPSN